MFKKFIKDTRNVLIPTTLIAITFPIAVMMPSDYGVIPKEIGLQLIGYGGSILGGFLTLYGVWWTIINQNKDQFNTKVLEYEPMLDVEVGDHIIQEHPIYTKICEVFVGDNDADNDWTAISTIPILVKNYNSKPCVIEQVTYNKNISKCKMDIDSYHNYGNLRINQVHSESFAFTINVSAKANLCTSLNNELLKLYFDINYSNICLPNQLKTMILEIDLILHEDDENNLIAVPYSFMFH